MLCKHDFFDTLQRKMPMKTALSFLFVPLFAVAAHAQDAAPAAAEPSPEAIFSPADEKAAAEAPADMAGSVETKETTPAAAAEGVAIPDAGNPTASDGNPLFAEPIDSIPGDMPLLDDGAFLQDNAAQERTFKRSKTAIANDQLRLRIKLREAKTKALKDEKIQDALARADAATTPAENREAMKEYYKLLNARIIKIDSSLKTLSEERTKLAVQKLSQRRLRPLGESAPETWSE